MTSRSRAATAALLACGALGLAGTQLAPASASAPTTAPASTASAGTPLALPHIAPSGPATTVTLFLKAPDAAALDALAAQPITDRAARLKQVAALLPSAAVRTGVVSQLKAAGMTVDNQTSWSITATAPTSIVTGLFGTRPARGSHAVTTGPLSEVPAALASHVTAIFPTYGGPAAFSPKATSTLDGADFRNADTAAGTTPSTGTKDAGVTVATLQLADIPSSDLTTYASMNDLPDPVAAKRYRAVKVDGGPSTTDDDPASGGYGEVDLDQESILSTAPTASQAAYFAPNTDAGFDDVFANVLDDVVGNTMATAPDPHIVALSSSWGECEGETGAASIATLDPILAADVAAGVTVFASSGDGGIYDCESSTGTGLDNMQADVDYPASSPYVISAGGSNLSADSSAPNTGTNWTETAWSCYTPVDCQAVTGGGGGGASGSADGHTYVLVDPTDPTATQTVAADFAGFPTPAYQRASLTGAYAGQPTRLVPDIAADADPNTGFVTYDTQGGTAAGETETVGGTSLSSPISAAQLANTIADAGHTTGVGDIHSALYSALLETTGVAATSADQPFRDVTSGSNGSALDEGTDPSVSATTGYDTVGGVGGVLWNALLPYLYSTGTPAVTAEVTPGTVDGTSVPLTFDWTSSTAEDKILLDVTGVTVTDQSPSGTTTTAFTSSTPTTAATAAASATNPATTSITGTVGDTYTLTVTGTDLAGHAATATATYPTPPIDPAGTPTITGSKRVGVRITGHSGEWDPAATLSYQWLRNGTVVPGATRTTYLLGAADRGAKMTLRVTGAKEGTTDAVRTSTPTTAVAYGTQTRQPKPTLGGRATVGRQLKVHPGLHDAGVTLHYVWYAGGHRTGVTSQTFRVVRGDRHEKIRAVVTATEPGYRPVVKQTRTTRPAR